MQQAGKGTEHHVAAAMCPRVWDSPPTLYLELVKPSKPCQVPWGRII